jgi:hypothetical protein
MDDIERMIGELRECPVVEGATMACILELPDALRPTLKEMVRGRSFTHGEICVELGVDTDTATQIMALLAEKGYVHAAGPGESEPLYRVALAPIRGRPIGDEL